MEVSDEDPAYIVRFKAAFTEDLKRRKENTNIEWLQLATALDPRFKDLKGLPRTKRGEVWLKLSEMLKDSQPAQQPEPLPEPPKKRRALLLMGSDSESDEETLAGDKSLDRAQCAEEEVSSLI
ncbi:hypothetical protein NQZ68_029785 [Dissostichus eleginoides]|nr:hypothetical protein NQZ68_029785 [Dissostichus eleginoides]